MLAIGDSDYPVLLVVTVEEKDSDGIYSFIKATRKSGFFYAYLVEKMGSSRVLRRMVCVDDARASGPRF